MSKKTNNTNGHKKQAKNKSHGRRKHKPGGGCQSGMTVYGTKREAEAVSEMGEFRCGFCRGWHNNADRRRRGKKPERQR